jgi:hypothetical protein
MNYSSTEPYPAQEMGHSLTPEAGTLGSIDEDITPWLQGKPYTAIYETEEQSV